MCPACRHPFVPVLGGRNAGQASWCERCETEWILAQGARQQVGSRHARRLAREGLRRRALLPAEAAEEEKGKEGNSWGRRASVGASR